MLHHPPPDHPDFDRVWTWYHNTLATYGSWLPGDARGFRTRGHREHVEGDYRDRPVAGTHGVLEQTCVETLKQTPVVLTPDFRQCVGQALLERLRHAGALVIAISVASQHVHLLAKMPMDRVRSWLGMAKRHAWFEMRDRGWEKKLWAKGGRNAPVHDRVHQLNTYQYIVRHAEQGAWVWKWGDDREGR